VNRGAARMKRRLWAFALAMLGLSCRAGLAAAPAPFPDGCKLQADAVLPATLAHGHVAVGVGVNGHPLSFMVDTGGFFSAIDGRAVERLGLQTHDIRDDILITDAGDKEVKHYARIDALTIGKTRAQGLTLMVLDLGADGEDGALGPDLLRNFDVDFDFAQKTLILFKPHRCDEHVVYWTDDFSTVPFELTEQGHIRIPVTVNGKSLRAVLDTGAPSSFLGGDAAARLAPAAGFSGPAEGGVSGAGGSLSFTSRGFDSLAIGSAQWKAPTLLVRSTPQALSGESADMLIGMDVLSATHLYIDYRNRRLYISRRTDNG
jgi:predicted aspartyl protease